MGEIVFVLTTWNFREGGRTNRPALDMNLRAKGEHAAYLGDAVFACRPEGGEPFEARLSGTRLHNFRSNPGTALGKWLKVGTPALPGDEVHAWWVDADARVLGMRYVRTQQAEDRERGDVQARRIEQEIEEALCLDLARSGVEAQRQVRLRCGVADVMTPDAIYEVKAALTRDSIVQAVGQLSIYRAEADDGHPWRLIVVGRETRETAALLPTLAKLGVEVELWQK